MKKKILALCLCVALVAVAVAGVTMAYFTDTDSATNTFTMGSVEIKLLESKLHRTGQDSFIKLSDEELAQRVKASGMSNIPDNWDVFTDDAIKADAANYATYLEENGQNLVPGQYVAKCVYLENTGKSDAYVRIRVLINSAITCTHDMYTSAAQQANSGKPAEFNMTQTQETRNGVTYDVLTFTRVAPLEAGKMTEWNVFNHTGLQTSVTSEQVSALIESGAIGEDGSYDIIVEADAIQAEGFDDAAAAWAAFSA